MHSASVGCLILSHPQISSQNSTNVSAVVEKGWSYCYSVKVINARKKSDFTLEKFRLPGKFTTVTELKEKLSEFLKYPVETAGYITPGHGVKGKMQDLVNCEDLHEMYKCHDKRKEILLWCFKPGDLPQEKRPRKRSRSTDEDDDTPKSSKSKRDTIAKKISEVEEIVQKLKDKHGPLYSIEKLNAWAHMINIGKHDSYETPPDLPYFRGKAAKKTPSPESVDTSNSNPGTSTSAGCSSDSGASPAGTGVSPAKLINMRTQLLSQMEQWHSLLEKGGITQQQYDELQAAILKDIYSNTFK